MCDLSGALFCDLTVIALLYAWIRRCGARIWDLLVTFVAPCGASCDMFVTFVPRSVTYLRPLRWTSAVYV